MGWAKRPSARHPVATTGVPRAACVNPCVAIGVLPVCSLPLLNSEAIRYKNVASSLLTVSMYMCMHMHKHPYACLGL